MMGITGLRILHRDFKGVVTAPQNLVHIQFPQKTVVRSAQLIDSYGRPVYRGDIHV